MRKLALVVALCVAAASLTGCTVTGSLVDKAQIDLALAQLTTELEETPGVTGVTTTAELQGDYTYVVSVHALADFVKVDLTAVAALATEHLGTPGFDRQVVSFDLMVGETQILSIYGFDFSDDELAADLAYRAALSDAYGEQLGLSLSSYEDGNGRVIFAPVNSPSPDWAAMRAVPDQSTTQFLSWQFGGLDAQGSFPDEQTTQLYDALLDIVPVFLTPSEDDYFSYMQSYGGSVDVYLQDPLYDLANPTAYTRWPLILEIVHAVADSEVSGVLGVFSDGVSGDAVVTFGECATIAPPTDRDSALAAAIGRPDFTAGRCMPEV